MRAVDVVEDDGVTLGCDPACEAAAERDPDALLDFLLDPHRGAGDELVGILVHEHDRAGVGAEDRARRP